MSAPAAGLQVEGARDLRASLRRAAGDLNQLKDAHRAAADIVAGAAAPGSPVVSGQLASTVRPGATARAAVVRAGGASAPYARPIHWGWPNRNIEPQPFVYDAATSTEDQWLDAYQQDVQDVLDRIKGAPTP